MAQMLTQLTLVFDVSYPEAYVRRPWIERGTFTRRSRAHAFRRLRLIEGPPRSSQRKLLRWISMINLDLVVLSPFECTFAYNFYTSLISHTVLPLIAVGVILAVRKVLNWAGKPQAAPRCATAGHAIRARTSTTIRFGCSIPRATASFLVSVNGQHYVLVPKA